MKVLHVIPSISGRSGGPGQAIIPMCRSLQEQGAEVAIATTNADLREQVALGLTGTYKGIRTIFFTFQWGQSFKYSKPLAAWLDASVQDFDVVHIHAVFNHACLAAARACRKHGVPYVVRPLGTLDPWSMKQKPLRKFLFWQLAGKRMLRGAAAVHYTATAERAAAEASLGLNHGRVIPLGVDASPASVNGDGAQFEQFAKLEGHPFVLVLSRLHPKKGLDVFIDAFAALVKKDQFTGWRLVLAGEGPPDYVKALKEKVASYAADQLVLFPGWMEGKEKDTFLQHASLLALPSYHENFGLCVMEALAAGVPVLVSPHVNLASEIQMAGAGWIAEVDSATIEKELGLALASSDERARRGQAGKVLSEQFSCRSVAARLIEMYDAVQRQN